MRVGCEVFTAENGMDAIQVYQAHQNQIDLVILDIAMPVMDGSECFYKLKSINPQLPIVISTGYSDETQTDPLLSKGAAGLLPKPYDLAKMAALIRRPIARK
jgi:CheY-like chemotaxis protein